ncbi:hypothetical protein PMAYCL1PPCAC_25239, partial [Pristionchus mayeri]
DGFIRFEVDEVSKIFSQYSEYIYSPEVEVKGIPWKTMIWDEGGVLGVVLQYDHKQSTFWRIDGNVEYTLVHPDRTKNVSIKMSGIGRKGEGGEWAKYRRSTELGIYFKGFVKDNKISVEVRIWLSGIKGIRIARKIDFTDSNVPYHDIALVIEGEKIYVSKQILAANSPVFESMFYSDFAEKDKNEIQLNDVEQKEFIKMLNVIYQTNKMVENDSAEFLLKLGDQFQIESVIERAERSLIDNRNLPIPEKMEIADQYNMYALKEHCFAKLTTRAAVKVIE